MDVLSILALATQCSIAAPAPIVAAMTVAETGGEVYSIQIDDTRIIPSDFDEAVQIATTGMLQGANVKIGIANIPTQEFDRRDISYSEGFSACRNLEMKGEILRDSWERFGGQDEHWRLAVLETATGNPALEGEFSQKFDNALTQIKQLAQTREKPKIGRETSTPQGTSNPAETETSLSEQAAPYPSWNIYGRGASNPLLVYSK